MRNSACQVAKASPAIEDVVPQYWSEQNDLRDSAAVVAVRTGPSEECQNSTVDQTIALEVVLAEECLDSVPLLSFSLETVLSRQSIVSQSTMQPSKNETIEPWSIGYSTVNRSQGSIPASIKGKTFFFHQRSDQRYRKAGRHLGKPRR